MAAHKLRGGHPAHGVIYDSAKGPGSPPENQKNIKIYIKINFLFFDFLDHNLIFVKGPGTLKIIF